MRDEEIIKLYFDRDGDAVARTQEKYGAYLYTVSYDLIRNEQDAEDAVQQALLQLTKHIGRIGQVDLHAAVHGHVKHAVDEKHKHEKHHVHK